MAIQEVRNHRLPTPRRELPARYQTLRASRAPDIDKKTITAMRLAILKGLRAAPGTPFVVREEEKLSVTLLEEATFERAMRASRYLTHMAIQDIRDELKDYLPASDAYPLNHVPVREIGVIGSETNPTVALMLDAPLVAHESRTLIRGLEEISETSLGPRNPRPHISLASFPEQTSVPDSVISELSAVTPRRVNLHPVGFTMFEIS